MNSPIRRIAISTGGGDAPGLNAVIRATVSAALKRGWECVGIRDGYNGLLAPELCLGEPVPQLLADHVHGIGHLGGNLVDGVDRCLESLLLAADRLRLLGVVPELRVLNPRIQLVEPAKGAFPVERQAHQRQRRIDPVDVSLALI